MGSRVESLMYLPREIWQSSVFPLLSLKDMCRLDSAFLNKCARPSILSALTAAEVQHEVILTPDVINWVTSRKVKLLRVKLIEDVSTEELLQFTKCNPQLLSLNTCWDFKDRNNESPEESLEISDICDMMCVDNDCRRLDEQTLIFILQHCPHLKCLSVCEMSFSEWCGIITDKAGLFTHLEEVKFRDSWCDDGYFQFFYLSRTALKMDIIAMAMDTPLLTSIATHFPTLTTVELASGTYQPDIDAGILAIAHNCTSLNKIVLGVTVWGDTLLELCRLRPNLVDLQIAEYLEEEDYQPIVQEVMRLLPGLQVFFCYTAEEGDNDPLFHTLADCLPDLRMLRVTRINCMSEECWEDILRKCTKLRTVQSEASYEAQDIQMLVEHGIAVEYTPPQFM